MTFALAVLVAAFTLWLLPLLGYPKPGALHRDAVSTTGVILFVQFFEVFLSDVGIDLGRCNIDMPEHYLNRPQIRAAFQQVAGKRVAQHVRGYLFSDAGFKAVAFDQFPKALAAHRPACPCHEQKWADLAF